MTHTVKVTLQMRAGRRGLIDANSPTGDGKGVQECFAPFNAWRYAKAAASCAHGL